MFADIKLRVDKLAMCNLPLEETEIVFSTQKRLKVYKVKKQVSRTYFALIFMTIYYLHVDTTYVLFSYITLRTR